MVWTLAPPHDPPHDPNTVPHIAHFGALIARKAAAARWDEGTLRYRRSLPEDEQE